MQTTKKQLWDRFNKYYRHYPTLGMELDVSRISFSDSFFESMEARMQKAFSDMAALEAGAIANPDENRMVGHYWLRNPELAPTPEIRAEIETAIESMKDFAARIHTGTICGEDGKFENLLVIGIGGSALGPQFVSRALGDPKTDKMKVFFFDNTDPEGMDYVLKQIGEKLGKTLVLVISKSGGTKETRNGMLEAENAFKNQKKDFGKHAVAITSQNSELYKYAESQKWIKKFPMWDWVGGRTSEMSLVGLVPAILQGINVKDLLDGAKECDKITRSKNISNNPAALISLCIYYSCGGNGSKNMVVLPYKDSLELFSKYLQQLIMESLGKGTNLKGDFTKQGLFVFGNKGSTDQHSYVQQLRDGIDNFFAVFVESLKDREENTFSVESNVTSGDYLSGFFLGTRQALYENGRESITITVNKVSPFSIGLLIALFERVVGFYASLIEINAYHQPGVEAGKKAAAAVIEIQQKLLAHFKKNPNKNYSCDNLAKEIGLPEEAETIFKICKHLAANPKNNNRVKECLQAAPQAIRFSFETS